MDQLTRLGAAELLDGYAARDFSPVEVVDALVERIDEVDSELKAFAALALERARGEARQAEARYVDRAGERRPLEGVPLAVKDLFDTAGLPTTYGSPMFAGHVPREDAEAVRRARDAGAIVLGKTATHEFAWGITSANAHFDWGRNPWARDRVSGGSSGGSAVALATHTAPLALGSDTGGSIRVPAAFCGVVGFKPTYGLVGTEGVFPLAPSLDHAGPLARTPVDAALLFSVLAWPAARAATADLRAGVRGMRVGVCPDLAPVGLSEDVRVVFDVSLQVLQELGCELDEVALPEGRAAARVFAVVQGAEALETHRRYGLFPERRLEYGSDVRGRLEAAMGTTLADYVDAAAARERMRAGFIRAFEELDFLVTPVAASSPAIRGSEELEHLGEIVPFRQLVLPFTTPQDLAGLPACSVRAGFDRLGVPVGIQLTARPGADALVLRAAYAFWQATASVQQPWPA